MLKNYSLIKQFKSKFMKSTKKFLCYSLALVGAALIFSVGCKKTTTTTTNIVAAQVPVLTVGSPTFNGSSSATLVAQDMIQSMGSSSITVVGFNYTARALTYTGSTTPTYTGTVTASIPTGTAGTGAFTASLFTSAAATALSMTAAGANNVVWMVSSYATNGAGTTYSALTNTVTTTN